MKQEKIKLYQILTKNKLDKFISNHCNSFLELCEIVEIKEKNFHSKLSS